MPRRYTTKKRKFTFRRKRTYRRRITRRPKAKPVRRAKRAIRVSKKRGQYHTDTFTALKPGFITGAQFELDGNVSTTNTKTYSAGFSTAWIALQLGWNPSAASTITNSDFNYVSRIYEYFRINSIECRFSSNYSPSNLGGGGTQALDPRVLPNAVELYSWFDPNGELSLTTSIDASNLGVKPVILPRTGAKVVRTYTPVLHQEIWGGNGVHIRVPKSNKSWLPTNADGIGTPYFGLRVLVRAIYNTRNDSITVELPDVEIEMRMSVSFWKRKAVSDGDPSASTDVETIYWPIPEVEDYDEPAPT